MKLRDLEPVFIGTFPVIQVTAILNLRIGDGGFRLFSCGINGGIFVIQGDCGIRSAYQIFQKLKIIGKNLWRQLNLNVADDFCIVISVEFLIAVDGWKGFFIIPDHAPDGFFWLGGTKLIQLAFIQRNILHFFEGGRIKEDRAVTVNPDSGKIRTHGIKTFTEGTDIFLQGIEHFRFIRVVIEVVNDLRIALQSRDGVGSGIQ